MQIIITGISRGLGLAMSKSLLQRGHTVVGISRTEKVFDELESLSLQSNNASFIGITADITQEDEWQRIYEIIRGRTTDLHALINNAGILINKPFSQMTADDFDRMFSVNVKAVFFGIRTLSPLMQSGSHILNIASMGGVQGSVKFPGLSLYSASKAAVAVMTEVLAEELRPRGIHVNCIAPGSIKTEMFKEAFPGVEEAFDPEALAEFISDFTEYGFQFFNGKILPISATTP